MGMRDFSQPMQTNMHVSRMRMPEQVPSIWHGYRFADLFRFSIFVLGINCKGLMQKM
jgi:hypothetical protein